MENRFALLPRLCQCYIILFFSNIVLVSGCSNETDPVITPDVSDEQTTDSPVVIVTPEEHPELAAKFQELQDLFPPPILDEGFKTLHEMSASKPYLKFLRTAYPNVLHQDLNTFFKNSLPSEEKAEMYMDVLKKYFGKATQRDIRAVHHLHHAFQSTRISVYHGKGIDEAINEVLKPIVLNGRSGEWAKNFPIADEIDEDAFDAFIVDLEHLSRDIEFANVKKINQFLQRYDRKGKPGDGFIWLMLTDPVLMGQILQDFIDTETFRKWLRGGFKEPEIIFFEPEIIFL